MNDPSNNTTPRLPRGFRTTHWSLVIAASTDANDALQELCSAYWPPLHWHLRRLGYDAARADDLTQAFFAQMLDKRLLSAADRRRGRFRTFLLTALRRFVVNEWKHQGAIKRGGGAQQLSLESGGAELSVAADAAHDLTPDRLFERQWALLILQRAFQALEAEHREPDKQALFDALAPCLARDETSPSYDELANELRATPAALRMSVSRLRARLRELVREEIRKTVRSETDVDDEVRDLFRALQA